MAESKPGSALSRLKDKRQRLFVEALPKHNFNASAAAREAGYAESTADKKAASFMTRPHIAEAIAEVMQSRVERVQYDADRLLQDMVDVMGPAKREAMTGEPKSVSAFANLCDKMGKHTNVQAWLERSEVNVVDHDSILTKALERARLASRERRKREQSKG